jgi:hypothetical protein
MDPFSMIIVLLIALMAWSQGISWLFFGAIILFIITARRIGIIAIALVVFGTIYVLKLRSIEQLFIVAVVLVGATLWAARKEEAGGGGEMYSPELMQLLGGYGGH